MRIIQILKVTQAAILDRLVDLGLLPAVFVLDAEDGDERRHEHGQAAPFPNRTTSPGKTASSNTAASHLPQSQSSYSQPRRSQKLYLKARSDDDRGPNKPASKHGFQKPRKPKTHNLSHDEIEDLMRARAYRRTKGGALRQVKFER